MATIGNKTTDSAAWNLWGSIYHRKEPNPTPMHLDTHLISFHSQGLPSPQEAHSITDILKISADTARYFQNIKHIGLHITYRNGIG